MPDPGDRGTLMRTFKHQPSNERRTAAQRGNSNGGKGSRISRPLATDQEHNQTHQGEQMNEITPHSSDVPPPPAGLGGLQYPHLYAPFGFKIVEVDGESMWTLATESDYVDAESRRLGLPREKIKRPICRPSGPTTCHPDGCCALFYDSVHQHYYCSC